MNKYLYYQFSSVAQSCPTFCDPMDCMQHVRPSITSYRSSFKLTLIESVMPPNNLVLCRPFFLLPSIFPSIRVFSGAAEMHTHAHASKCTHIYVHMHASAQIVLREVSSHTYFPITHEERTTHSSFVSQKRYLCLAHSRCLIIPEWVRGWVRSHFPALCASLRPQDHCDTNHFSSLCSSLISHRVHFRVKGGRNLHLASPPSARRLSSSLFLLLFLFFN